GIGEVGRNMTVFEYDGRLLIVDCGVLFPEDEQPGVDLILRTSGRSRSGWTTSTGLCSRTATRTTSGPCRSCYGCGRTCRCTVRASHCRWYKPNARNTA